MQKFNMKSDQINPPHANYYVRSHKYKTTVAQSSAIGLVLSLSGLVT